MQTLNRLAGLLEPDQRRVGMVLLVLMLVAMVLETASLGLIIPVLALITDPAVVQRYPWLHSVMATLDGDRAALVGAAMAAMVMLYAVKGGFLAFLAWWQARFVFSIESGLSRRLYAGYLRQPYHFHMQRNSALLVRNITTGVTQSAGAVMSGAILASECLVLFGIAALLLYAEPLGALLVGGTLAAAGYVFHRLTRDRVLRWGKARQYHEGQRLQRLQQGLGGVRDVKLLGCEAQFIADYETHNRANAAVGKRQSIVTALPRLWLELLSVLSLTVLVLSMIYQGKPVEAIVPTLGLFAAAAFRLLPSLNKVLNVLQNLRYNLPFVAALYEEREMLESAGINDVVERSTIPLTSRLKIEHVSYCYPGSSQPVFDDATIDIPSGATVGFIGASGAGKSTLVNLVLGLLSPTSGRILADGVDIHADIRRWQASVGYVPQSVFLVDDTLRRNVAFGLRDDEIDEAAVARAIEGAQLAGFVRSLPDGLDTRVGERGVRLSGGQCQRIGIARALYYDGALLVFDEASSALDHETEAAVMETVESLKARRTILIVAHRLTTIARCDLVYEIGSGRVRPVDKAKLKVFSSGSPQHV